MLSDGGVGGCWSCCFGVGSKENRKERLMITKVCPWEMLLGASRKVKFRIQNHIFRPFVCADYFLIKKLCFCKLQMFFFSG